MTMQAEKATSFLRIFKEISELSVFLAHSGLDFELVEICRFPEAVGRSKA